MLNPDFPITKSSDDKLNRGSFADNLAELLVLPSFPTPFSIGLYGKWGSGKTSLLNMVLEKVESRSSNTVILRFNPWLCSDPGQLVSQFFKQLASKLQMKEPAGERVSKALIQYSEVLNPVFSLLSGTEAAGVRMIAKIIRALAKKWANQPKDIQRKKDEIISELLKSDLRIIIAIDDIDRLSNEEIVSVFQLVKTLADFPNTVYLLAFDYDIVIRALETVQHGDGQEYLEKIIQVPFAIPDPDIISIQELLFLKLEEIFAGVPETRYDKELWGMLFDNGMKKYIKSIRDVNRYTNVLYLKYLLLYNEVDPVDLLGLVCLQVFEPSVYSVLNQYKNILTGSIDGLPNNYQKDEEGRIKSGVENILAGKARDAGSAKNILAILFPKVKTAMGLRSFDGRYYKQTNFIANHNIASPACFNRYFSLTLENDGIPSEIINRLIFVLDDNEVTNEIVRLYQNGKIDRLLEEIRGHASAENKAAISEERAQVLLRCLCRVWDSFNIEKYCYLPGWDVEMLRLSANSLLKRVDFARRFLFIKDLFEDRQIQPSTLALLLREFESQHGRCNSSQPLENTDLFLLDQVKVLELIFRQRCKEAIETRSAFSSYKGLDFLWMLNDIDEDLTTQIKKTLVTDDLSFANVISFSIVHGWAGKDVSRLDQKTRKINYETLEEFIDRKEASTRIIDYLLTDSFLQLSEDLQKDVIAFDIAQSRDKISQSIGDNVYGDEIEQKLSSLKNRQDRGDQYQRLEQGFAQADPYTL